MKPHHKIYCHPIRRCIGAALAAVVLIGSTCAASAAENPPLVPDTMMPFSTDSRISASIEFDLRTLAADIERDIPRRLASVNEKISCVHKRVLFLRVNANCDVWGYVERSGSVSLYGRGDHIYGSVPIHGVIEGQGANRITSRIHGETEASATIEAEAHPRLGRDWSLDLNVGDGFRWSEPPVLHVMGREIPLAKYAEPRIQAQLRIVRSRARAAAGRLNLRDKAAVAWRHAFEPIQLSDQPAIWLQLAPQNAAFAGVRADAKVLRGSLELTGAATTVVGQPPSPVTATPLPPLGHDVDEPGTFDVILPVKIGYDTIRDRLKQAVAAMPAVQGVSVRDIDVYPSSGKLVLGLRIAKASETDPADGKWIYLTGGIQVDADGHAVRFSDLAVISDDDALAPLIAPITAELGSKVSVDYGIAYENLLNAANSRLTRSLKDGFRMEGHLSSAQLEKIYLPADGIVIALRASGTLKILYGM